MPRARKLLPLCFALIALTVATGYGQLGRQTGSESAAPVTRPSAQAPQPKTTPQPRLQLLPPAFAGLPRQGDIVDLATAQTMDSAHAAVLQEVGFSGGSQASYAGDGPVSWQVQVLRFEDATGAYSAFTFYRDGQMKPEQAGTKATGVDAAASPSLFLARFSASLVMVRPLASTGPRADASKLSGPVAALISTLPRVHGPENIPPSLPGLLPAKNLDAATLHYAIGRAAYNGPIPANVVDFARDAEAVTAAYHLPGGKSAVMTLLMLPTPQIATAQDQAIHALPDGSLHVATRHLGPLLGVVSGAGVSAAEADDLLKQIHYRTDVTLDQPQGYISEVVKAARLLTGIAELTIALAIAAVVLAISFGGGRALLRRLQGKPASTMYDQEFISLKIEGSEVSEGSQDPEKRVP